eukprot:6156403-Prymnesium_polylepis.2
MLGRTQIKKVLRTRPWDPLEAGPRPEHSQSLGEQTAARLWPVGPAISTTLHLIAYIVIEPPGNLLFARSGVSPSQMWSTVSAVFWVAAIERHDVFACHACVAYVGVAYATRLMQRGVRGRLDPHSVVAEAEGRRRRFGALRALRRIPAAFVRHSVHRMWVMGYGEPRQTTRGARKTRRRYVGGAPARSGRC